jgi:hypothetical protein
LVAAIVTTEAQPLDAVCPIDDTGTKLSAGHRITAGQPGLDAWPLRTSRTETNSLAGMAYVEIAPELMPMSQVHAFEYLRDKAWHTPKIDPWRS